MLNANHLKRDCRKVVCESKDAYLEPSQGRDKIDYSGNKWGFTWQEIVASAMNGYTINNFANCYGLAKANKLNLDVKDEANFFAMQQGVSAPVLVQAPVCSGGLTSANLVRAAKRNLAPPDCYPCREVTWDLDDYAYCKKKDEWCRKAVPSEQCQGDNHTKMCAFGFCGKAKSQDLHDEEEVTDVRLFFPLYRTYSPT